MNNNLPRHDVICIDMKSFYASCEAVWRGLDPLTTKLVVVGDVNRNGSVVLAASPLMKTLYGIKTGSRLFEVRNICDTSIIIAQARMAHYLTTSKYITTIFERFVPLEAIHTYSVDESWLTLDGTDKLWGTPWEASRRIQKTIYDETGLIATIGIGDNKFLAKFVLDVYGKEQGIAEARYETVETLFHHLPIQDMWGVGPNLTRRLQNMNILTIGDLAHAQVKNMKNEFGIIGEQLWFQAWGIDKQPVFYSKHAPPPTAFGFFNDDLPNEGIKSVGRGVTLLRDYKEPTDILQVINDLTHEVCEILRRRHIEAKTIHLSITYSRHTALDGFSRQVSLTHARTNDPKDVYDQCMTLFYQFHHPRAIVRKVRVSVSGLAPEQLTLGIDRRKAQRQKLLQIMDKLNDKLGKGSIRTGSSYLSSSIAPTRVHKIGGHTK
ncbi:DNA polymerase thumb domain-containing protein [Metabacillus iocasae]|uniref:DNA polymerase V n=1 Tax=Priestia iocasae TaxID=2291674 RepID=A0ABS2QVN0_9BACI|nr:UV damage repair protein UvrX [Metabacillus iocasae]MBM7703530.1 DNA polymerase V [Metabacillus iocasae]